MTETTTTAETLAAAEAPAVPAVEAANEDVSSKITKPSAEESTTATEPPEDTPETDPAPPAVVAPVAVVSSSKRSRPVYKYDPTKVTLRFLFANRDGLTVTVECTPDDTISEVKAALLSVWPEDLPSCSSGDRLRLICMGKGILMPDSRNLQDCEVPVFKTHPTPINVCVRPENFEPISSKGGGESKKASRSTIGGGGASSSSPSTPGGSGDATSQGCACIIL